MRSILFLILLVPSLVLADEPAVQMGKDLYKAHCALCHGGQGQGVPPMFPGLNSKSADVYAAMMQNYRAGNGHKVMVDMAKSLTEAQVSALLVYVATFPSKKMAPK
jgi:cytochrome c oxidase subunit 2